MKVLGKIDLPKAPEPKEKTEEKIEDKPEADKKEVQKEKPKGLYEEYLEKEQ